jgi:hypothetical protein
MTEGNGEEVHVMIISSGRVTVDCFISVQVLKEMVNMPVYPSFQTESLMK